MIIVSYVKNKEDILNEDKIFIEGCVCEALNFKAIDELYEAVYHAANELNCEPEVPYYLYFESYEEPGDPMPTIGFKLVYHNKLKYMGDGVSDIPRH